MGYNTIPCNPYPISTEELNKGNNDELNSRVTALESDVSDLNTEKANKADIATVFSDLTNYNAGDLVYHEGVLYEFQVDHTAGAWETSEVIQKDLSDIITTLKSGLTNATTVSSGTITAEEGVTITNYTLQKSLKTVYLYMLVKFTPTIGTGQLLCVLPSGYRPQDRLLFAGYNGTLGKFARCETDSWGAVRIYPTSEDSSAVSTDYFLTITYFTS